MRTSLTEIRDIEAYLYDRLPPDEALVFEARRLTASRLRLNIGLQKKLYLLLAIYQRKKVKREVEMIHSRLFMDEGSGSLNDRIRIIFNQ